MEKIPNSILTMLAGIGLTVISLWYGQNHGLLPIAASDEALMVDGLFNTMMTIAMGLFLLVQGILIFAAVKYRQRPGDETDGPPIRGNIPLEILWTGIPAILVLVIAVYSFEVYNSMGGLDPMTAQEMSHHQMTKTPGTAIAATIPTTAETTLVNNSETKIALGLGAAPALVGKTPDVVVNVTGLQYAWIFNYPDKDITSGELHIPVGGDIQLKISATDVIHSFWMPEFRLKQDAIPGTPAEIRFTPKRVGTYPVVCAELCGAYHGGMRTQVIVHTPADFEAWVASQVAEANAEANNQNIDQAIALNQSHN